MVMRANLAYILPVCFFLTYSDAKLHCQDYFMLRNIENGSVEFTYLGIPGSVATFTCNPGYMLFGSPKLHCPISFRFEDLYWSDEMPMCLLPPCSSIGPLVNGRIETEDFGKTVNFFCDPDHQLIGTSSATCVGKNPETAAWNASLPRCQPNFGSCKPQNLFNTSYETWTELSIENGEVVIFDKHKPWIVAHFFCNEGYSLVGRQSLHCTMQGNDVDSMVWNGPVPYCVPLKCPDIGHIENGEINVIGSVARFSCHNGYQRIGPASATCSDKKECTTGEWSAQLPICIPTLFNCARLSNFPNGQMNIESSQNAAHPGMIATFTCNSGYMLIGHPTMNCTGVLKHNSYTDYEQIFWEGSPPSCVRINCPAIHLENGVISLEKNMASFTCDEGYELVGPSKANCLDDKNNNKPTWWPAALPRCERSVLHCNSDFILPDNGTVTITGIAAIFSCNPDYHLVGPRSAKCMGESSTTAKWSVDRPKCLPSVIECTEELSLENGSISLTDETRLGSKATFVCQNGSTLIGKSVLQCSEVKPGEKPTWNAPPPHCAQLNCQPFEDLELGEVVTDVGKLKTTFFCNPGYDLIGPESANCIGTSDETAYWDADLPTCLKRKTNCGDSFDFLNGNVTIRNEGSATKVAIFTCKEGFMLVGSPSLTCNLDLDDSFWDGRVPYCVRLNCPSIGPIPNGWIELTGMLASFHCDCGYRLHGSPVAKCVENSNATIWNDEVPRCLPVSVGCSGNLLIEHGNVSIAHEGYSYAVASFSCNPGYFMVGPRTIRCKVLYGSEVKAAWDGTPPKCQKYSCETSGLISNGRVEIIDNTAYFYCNSSFVLVGAFYAFCKLDNNSIPQWTAAFPTCVANPTPCISNLIIENGAVQIVKERDRKPVAEFYCDSGYLLNGSSTLTCDFGGKFYNRTLVWNGNPPHCAPISCPVVPKIANGHVSIQENVAHFSCDDGYKLAGPVTARCVKSTPSSAKWNVSAPSCIHEIHVKTAGCDYGMLFINNGKVIPSSQAELPPIITCDTGYMLVGSPSEIRCIDNENGTKAWSGEFPECVHSQCVSLKELPNGKVNLTNGNNAGSKAKFSCNQNYILFGSPSSSCVTSNGTTVWSHRLPSCVQLSCPELGKLQNGNVVLNAKSADENTLQLIATFTCSPGYNLSGTAILKCTGPEPGEMEWDLEKPHCMQLDSLRTEGTLHTLNTLDNTLLGILLMIPMVVIIALLVVLVVYTIVKLVRRNRSGN